MPNRIVKESAFTSEKISGLSDFQFRLWVGLITQADDYGNGDARPEILKGRLFVFRKTTVKDIADGLHALAAAGCVSLYMVDGKPYFQFPNWSKHQRVYNVKPKFPGPEAGEIIASACDVLPQSAADCGELPQSAAYIKLNPNPNPNPNQIKSPAKMREGETEDFFCSVWALYPNQKGKTKVSKESKRALVSAGREVIEAAIERYKEEIKRNGTEKRYIMHGSTFFNGRWREYAEGFDEEVEPKEIKYVNHRGEKIPWTLDYDPPVGRPLTADECLALGVLY